MPFVRFTRDRRGYEHTYLLQFDPRKGRAHGRILYWFRTPPGVRVGRATFEEETRRMIEQAHPEVIFDWGALKKSLENTVTQLAQAGPEGSRRAPKKKSAPRRAQPAPAAPLAAPASTPAQSHDAPQTPDD